MSPDTEILEFGELVFEAERLSSIGAAIADAMRYSHNDRQMYTPAVEALQEMLHDHHIKLQSLDEKEIRS